MNRTAFRRFEFFDVETICDDVATKLGCLPTCVVAESGMLIFGDNKGHITFADRDFHLSDRRHKIFKGEVLGLAYLFDPTNSSRQFIFAVGDDSKANEENPNDALDVPPMYMIKVFATFDMNRPIHVVNATYNDAYFTSFAVSHDGAEIAVGYTNGRVVLFTGVFLKDSTSQSRPSQPIILHQQHSAPVSGLHFCELSVKNPNPDEKRMKLFVVMDTRLEEEANKNKNGMDIGMGMGADIEDINQAGIIVFDTSYVFTNPTKTSIAYNPRSEPRALDEKGATALCTSFLKNTRELAIARNEALYTYTVEDRGGALAIFGEKLCMSAVGRYTLVVSIDEKPSAPTVSDGASGSVTTSTSQKPRKPNVNIYDLKNKIICGTTRKYTLPASEKILFVMADSGMVYLITSSFNMIRFREKDVNRKLDVLLNQVQPPLYSHAIQLAGEEQMEPSEIMKLYKMFGDHLYSKHEYEAAVTQYCSTIGYIPPSYVIIKFLDPYRIHNLITYLEKIKEKMLAGPDHITLLLSCYTKIKEEKKISELLDYAYTQSAKLAAKKAHHDSNVKSVLAMNKAEMSDKDLFEPLQAIKILSSAGFTEHALKVAVKYLKHDSYFSIQLSKNPPQYDEAMGYLAYTCFVCNGSDVLSIINQHGRQLLQARTKSFTQFLVKLCTADMDFFLPTATIASSPKRPGNGGSAIGGGNVLTGTDGNMANIWSSDFWRVLHGLLSANKLQSIHAHNDTPLISPQDVIGLFHDLEEHLIIFLDGIIQGSKGRLLAPKVWMTVLELYMQKYQQAKVEIADFDAKEPASPEKTSLLQEMNYSVKVCEQTIMGYIDGANVQYDASHVLLLCHMFGFEKGEKYLLEKQNYVELLMSKMIALDDTKEIMKLLRKEGSKEPELYVQVLTYFVQRTLQSSIKERKSRKSLMSPGRNSTGQDSDNDPSDSDDNDPHGGEDNESKWDSIVDVLDLIDKESILSPSQVLSILSINPELPLYIVAEYVSNTFKDLSDSIASIESDIKNAATKLETITFSSQAESEINNMRAKHAQEKALRKARIGYDDDDDDDDDDLEDKIVNLQKEKEKWMSIRKNQIEVSKDHETFYKDLDNSTDGFSTIASYFGRSLVEYS